MGLFGFLKKDRPEQAETPEKKKENTEHSDAASQKEEEPKTLPTENDVIEVLKSCYDPEIPVNIYELGLIYGVEVANDGVVDIKMTLTTPHCPAAQSMPSEIQHKVRNLSGVTDVNISIVWTPPWTPEMMSESAKLELGLF